MVKLAGPTRRVPNTLVIILPGSVKGMSCMGEPSSARIREIAVDKAKQIAKKIRIAHMDMPAL